MNVSRYPEPGRAARPSRSGLNALLIACAVTVALSFIPFASIVLYPIRLFVTFVHESSHALVAIVTGGSVSEIVIHPDASGYTLTSGGYEPLIATAGYLGATAFGAWLLALGRTPGHARFALLAAASIAGGATVLFVRPWDNLFGFCWGIVIAVGLAIARKRLAPAAAELLAMFLGVQCALNALLDLRTLIELSTRYGGEPTDAALMAQLTHVPSVAWAFSWSILALVILWRGLRRYWVREKVG
jgi:hypothetical protein